MPDPLAAFAPATATWFRDALGEPTPAQAGAWSADPSRHLLVVAPTGSGKTLAAFLAAIDSLLHAEPPADDEPRGTSVLYVSPLKALAVNVERNLRSPLVGITQTAARRGEPFRDVSVGVRSGDTPPAERRRLATKPPDVLITTPESLFLMLTSAARETLTSVHTVIVDEIHAVAGTKRGAHLALSLERLDSLLDRPARRIGLSATVRPHEEVARFLGGRAPVEIVAPPSPRHLDLRVDVPVDDLTAIPSIDEDSPAGTIWPHIENEVLDLIAQHRSTLVFVNSRGLAERLTSRLNEGWAARQGAGRDEAADARAPAQVSGGSGQSRGVAEEDTPVVARAHHGSVSKDQRELIEDQLKAGTLPCVVATSSLELGIDMGAIDLVVQIAAPQSVATGLQRVGRAGHQVGGLSRGVVFPTSRADLVGAVVTAERMLEGRIEALRVPSNPLDVLAQQTVAACALDVLDVDDWFETVRRCAPFAALPRSAYDATLDLVSGRYPSEEFAELRPRVVWDRDAATLTGRPGSQRLAVTSGGTIPDRGMFSVVLPADEDASGKAAPRRVGELDEEMVHESRIHDVISLGASSWRIREITHDRVIVTPAPGLPARLPFWRGDAMGRSAELGEAIGAGIRELEAAPPVPEVPRGTRGHEGRTRTNLAAFLADQREATGVVPTDRTLVVECFRDEVGDWRIVLLSPYGRRVHAPWALAVGARIRDRWGLDGAVVASDDGIVARLPDHMDSGGGAGGTGGGAGPRAAEDTASFAELFLFEPDELERVVAEEVGGSALFASRFRECAARALLLPRRNPGARAPLWQQRQRSAQLLDVARRYPDFPILLETARECLQDVYDLPALDVLIRRIATRDVRLVEVVTEKASPFAQTLVFGYVAAFLYEGDAPLAERRASALSLDSGLLAELLGRAELRELLDPEVLAEVEAELQHLAPSRKTSDAERVADLVRRIGPLSTADVAERSEHPDQVAGWLADLRESRRLIEVQVAGEPRWAAVEDAGRLRDALGVALPLGIAEAHTAPVPDPLGDLVVRYARSHGPFTAAEVAKRLGLGTSVVLEVLRRLVADDRITEGEFRPQATGTEWVEPEVLRRLRRRSLAAARRAVEPVDTVTYARFLPSWHQVGTRRRGAAALLDTLDQLAGLALPASAWESVVLPSRVDDYSPAMLDELVTAGEVVWAGAGSLGAHDGWVALHPGDLVLPVTAPAVDPTPLHEAVLESLSGGGAYRFTDLQVGVDDPEGRLAKVLWDLAWAGRVSNDSLAPLRAKVGGRGAHRQRGPAPRGRRPRGAGIRPVRPPAPPALAGRWFELPDDDTDPTALAVARAETLVARHGVLTRGAVVAEQTPGGFAGVYRVLREAEDRGTVLRGLFVDGLGGTQFARSATVDRLRDHALDDPDDSARDDVRAVVLAATDPAQPFGAALAWPERSVADEPGATKHRPSRRAGALVAMHDGHLVAFVERGGRRVLTWTDDPVRLAAAATTLVAAVRGGRLGRYTVEQVDDRPVSGTAFGAALQEAGFEPHPKGLRLR